MLKKTWGNTHIQTHTALGKKQRSKSQGRWLTALRFWIAFRKSAIARNQSLPMVTVAWSTSRCLLSPCLFNFYAEYIMQNAGPNESQAGIRFARKNINNLRYADDITLMAQSKEELASWWRWKRRVKKLTWNSTFKKSRSWHLVPSLYDK